MVALSRSGIRHFWTQTQASVPALRALEVLPVAVLLAACVALTIGAGPVMMHAQATAEGLAHPADYRTAVMAAPKLEADLLFKEHASFRGAIPEFSSRISDAINAVTDAVAEKLDAPGADPDDADALFATLAPEHLPETLADLLLAWLGET